MLTDLNPQGVAGGYSVFNCRSIASLPPSLVPRGKEMLGGLFEWRPQCMGCLVPDHMGTSGAPAVPEEVLAAE